MQRLFHRVAALIFGFGSLIGAADTGQAPRIFVAGHSFHVGMRQPLGEIVRLAGHENGPPIPAPLFVGNSRVIQVWDVPLERNPARQALEAGIVDVLTVSSHRKMPDEGIANFAGLALAQNASVRITVQTGWLPFDREGGDPVPGPPPKDGKPPVDWDAATAESLLELHASYLSEVYGYLHSLNSKLDRPVLSVVPTCHAVIALRERVRLGRVPGIRRQADLFSDRMGHPRPVIDVLNAYCHYSVIFGRSPVGMGIPPSLRQVPEEVRAGINAILQEIAWEVVQHHPLGSPAAPVP